MTLTTWLEGAVADVNRRGLPDVAPVLEGLARAAAALRTANWNDDASGQTPVPGPPALPGR